MNSMVGRIKTLARRYWPYFLIFTIYFLVAVFRFYGITSHITTTVPGSNGDTYQNLWGIWWVGYAIFRLHSGIFYTNILYWPIGANLVYQTMSPLGSLLVYPLQAISIPFAYNVLFILGFALSGLTMYVLADHFVKNRYAAFVAGLVFAFGAFHIAEAYAHLNWINIEWIPLALYFFIRILEDNGNIRNSIGLGISYVLAVFMGDVEQGVMLILLFALVIVFYLLSRTKRNAIGFRTFKLLFLSAVISFVIGAWGFVPIISAVGNAGNISIINEYNSLYRNLAQSYDLLSFFLPSFYNGFMSNHAFLSYYSVMYAPSPIERTGYITYTVLSLLVIAVLTRRKELGLWATVAILSGFMALGPVIHVYSVNTGIPGPFAMLRSIPLLNIIMEPGRFGVILFLATSIIASYGVLSILKLSDKKLRYNGYIVVIIISALFLFETSGSPITNSASLNSTTTTVSVPGFYYLARNITGNFSIIQIPAIQNPSGLVNLYTGEATYYTSASHKPMLGGYITRVNSSENEYLDNIPLAVQTENIQSTGSIEYESPVSDNYVNQTLLVLYNYRTLFVVLNKEAYSNQEASIVYAELSSIFGNPVYASNTTVAFETANAIKNSVFKSFVMYPVLQDWAYIPINQYTNESEWAPQGSGLVAVYAPYPNATYMNTSQGGLGQYTLNATLSFTAVSTNPYAQLQVGIQTGVGSPEALAILNLTPYPQTYNVRLYNLVPGELGNYAIFTPLDNQLAGNGHNSDIFVYNMTISRRD